MAGSFRLRLVLHPPCNNYFTLGRIDEDQAQDYAKRKGWDERNDEMVGCGDEVEVKFIYIIRINYHFLL